MSEDLRIPKNARSLPPVASRSCDCCEHQGEPDGKGWPPSTPTCVVWSRIREHSVHTSSPDTAKFCQFFSLSEAYAKTKRQRPYVRHSRRRRHLFLKKAFSLHQEAKDLRTRLLEVESIRADTICPNCTPERIQAQEHVRSTMRRHLQECSAALRAERELNFDRSDLQQARKDLARAERKIEAFTTPVSWKAFFLAILRCPLPKPKEPA